MPLTCQFYWTSTLSTLNVFTGADLERRNLLYKYRGFWTYFEDEKWRYACWDMTYFIAFSFSYTATFFQTWIRATCLTKLSKQTTRQYSISYTIEDYRQIIIIVATKDSEKWLSLYAYWLGSISIVTLTHFRKTNSMAKVTTRASAVVTKMITSLAVKGNLATPQLL